MYDEKCLERIGANIKVVRIMRKMHQQDVADRLGISQTHLSNMEGGRVNCSLKHFIRLANIFDCQVETLLQSDQLMLQEAQEPEKDYSDDEIKLLLRMFKKLGK